MEWIVREQIRCLSCHRWSHPPLIMTILIITMVVMGILIIIVTVILAIMTGDREMGQPGKIYQCREGHCICQPCRYSKPLDQVQWHHHHHHHHQHYHHHQQHQHRHNCYHQGTIINYWQLLLPILKHSKTKLIV